MIAGHFGFAAAVEARERQTPTWALMLACVWLDIVFIPLFLAKVETMHVVPGTGEGYGSAIIYADYTHSLLGALVLSAIFGGVAGLFWGRRSAIVLAGVVFSHWLLDLIVHRGDMPILPGNSGSLPRLGFGLWRYPFAAMSVELAIALTGSYLYWRAARATAASSGASVQRRAHVAGLLVLV